MDVIICAGDQVVPVIASDWVRALEFYIGGNQRIPRCYVIASNALLVPDLQLGLPSRDVAGFHELKILLGAGPTSTVDAQADPAIELERWLEELPCGPYEEPFSVEVRVGDDWVLRTPVVNQMIDIRITDLSGGPLLTLGFDRSGLLLAAPAEISNGTEQFGRCIIIDAPPHVPRPHQTPLGRDWRLQSATPPAPPGGWYR